MREPLLFLLFCDQRGPLPGIPEQIEATRRRDSRSLLHGSRLTLPARLGYAGAVDRGRRSSFHPRFVARVSAQGHVVQGTLSTTGCRMLASATVVLLLLGCSIPRGSKQPKVGTILLLAGYRHGHGVLRLQSGAVRAPDLC